MTPTLYTSFLQPAAMPRKPVAIVLLFLVLSPFSAPFQVCDLLNAATTANSLTPAPEPGDGSTIAPIKTNHVEWRITVARAPRSGVHSLTCLIARFRSRVDEGPEYVAVVRYPDGREVMERFKAADQFRWWLLAFERDLSTKQWIGRSGPFILPSGWPDKRPS